MVDFTTHTNQHVTYDANGDWTLPSKDDDE